jgi:acyl transferase domain-containing protein/acyl carrier protein
VAERDLRKQDDVSEEGTLNDMDTLVNQNAIAIIGLSCRFPGAHNVQKFWENLKDGVESITFFSDEELEKSGVDPVLLSDPNYVKAGAMLKDIERFDAHFFGYSPHEANLIDPQQRIFMECAWEAIEDAAYNPETYPGLIGVFAGAAESDYRLQNIYSNPSFVRSLDKLELQVSNDLDYLATRVSYKLNLRGPSLTLQTACSTSLVAVNIACDSLLSGQSDMAIAGGVSIGLPTERGYRFIEGEIFSPDGHCRAFDTKAQGMLICDGVGVIVLKRLADALQDGDHIYAVIIGYAVNNDGSAKVGYTAPSVEGQANVITDALAISGIDPETISYVETHGTGTVLGDPIEIAALTQAFRAGTDKNGFCAVGSVKTNIGHAFTAAGIASLIKTVLMLEHKMIPPSLNFEEPNPKIDFVNSPFFVNTNLTEWKADKFPRRAGVSSFGVGGTNAHAILEEAPLIESSGKSRPLQLVLLSAQSNPALDAMTKYLLGHLEHHPGLNLADIAYTLNTGRKTFAYRRMLVCQKHSDSIDALQTLDPNRVRTSVQQPINREIVFMFSGQGAQYVNMGLEVYRTESVFREEIDRCSEILKPQLSVDLRDILYPEQVKGQAQAEKLKQTSITQPALFVIEYALAKLWMSWGIHPAAMVGHSIGEYVAACLSGVFSLEDALSIVSTRGRLMQQLPAGSMLAVQLSEQESAPFLKQGLCLAAVNAPSFCVVAGEPEDVSELERNLEKRNIGFTPLHTSHAFHSQMMDPILDAFKEHVGQVRVTPPQIPYLSNFTGTWITAEQAMDPNYWARHLRETIRFSDCVRELLKEPNRVLLEVGPGQTLSMLARQHSDGSTGRVVLSSIRHPKEETSDIAFILNTLGRLWLAGVEVDWAGFYKDERRHRLPLPTYPFERQRYWIEPQKTTEATGATKRLVYGKKDLDDWFYIPSWKRSPLPKVYGQRILSDQTSSWLVFVDECGFGDKVIHQLQEAHQKVTSVKTGAQFSQLSEAAYTLNPQAREEYHTLFNELRASDRIPDTILHLWSLTEAGTGLSGSDFLKICQDLGFYSLLFLAQAIGEQLSEETIQIKVISNNLQEVIGDEALTPEKATLLGPCRVFSQEYPNVECASIDIVLPKSGTQQEKELQELILGELTAKTSDPIVAYRGSHRWMQVFEPIRLEKLDHLKPRLRDNGVYLITGGLGGIGLVLAEYLTQTVKAKLVLIGRTALPPRSEWESWLKTHSEQDVMSRKILKLQSIEEIGAELLPLSADVTDMAQMEEAIAQAHERFGQIHGVIHAAGIAGDRIMQVGSLEEGERVMASKVKGTLILDRLLRKATLDFFLLSSSITSILGGVGQVAYSAANAFLDAYAHQHRSKQTVISINWGPWQEIGMAVNTAVPENLKEEREQELRTGILPQEGKEAFSRILGSSFPQLIVSTRDFSALIEQSKRVSGSSSFDKTATDSLAKPVHARPDLSSAYVLPGNPTEQIISEIWQQVLGIEKVGIHDNFFELGGHSLLAVQVTTRLRNKFHNQFPITSLFERPTVHLLSEMILKEEEEVPAFEESSIRGKKREERRLQRLKR